MVKEIHEDARKNLPPEGPWKDEPDYQHWVDEKTGLDCLIVRQPSGGHLCGYVGIPKNHPLYGIGYGDCTLPEARKPNAEELAEHLAQSMAFNIEHLKYTPERAEQATDFLTKYWKERKRCKEEYCQHTPEYILSAHGGITYSAECNDRICHKTDDGDHVWWFGFDCAHSGDKSPGYDKLSYSRVGVYRTVHYVENECRSLARQLKEYELNGEI